VKAIVKRLSYPVIIKPVLSTSWLKPEIISIIRESSFGGTPKVALCRDAEQLIQTYDKIAAYDPRMVIQEIIPGEDKRLVYFCFYLDRQSKPLASFAGRKLRVFPVGFGSATYVKSFRDPELEAVSLKLLTGTRYQGLGGVEFKKDPRDEKYKIIEFNARFGMWDTLGIRCGIDLPYIAYCDALGLPFKAHHHYREEIMWIDFQRDIRAFFIYRKRGQLNLKSWLRSLKGEKDWATYSRDDWKPALVATARLFEDAWSRVKKMLRVVVSSGARA
jgi:predicted ATP-grasp superfamily ATP-dependent carboligase